MGNYFSSIDESIEDLMFYPPKNRTKEHYLNLNQNTNYYSSKLSFVTTKKNSKVYFVAIEPKKKFTKYIVFSHGNGSDICDMFSYCVSLCVNLNVGCILYDYLGYGLSDSNSFKPSEERCYESHETIINYVKTVLNIQQKNIILMGQSIGTGVVVDYIWKNKWNSPSILVSPYKSILRVACDSSSMVLSKPIDKFNSVSKMREINCPIKIFHGNKDEVIAISHGKELFEKLNDKTFEPVWFDGIGHNDILQRIEVDQLKEVTNFESVSL